MEASIRMLLRLPHGSVTTLLDGLARYYGYTEESLLMELDAKISPTHTASMMIDELTERGQQLIEAMLADGFIAQPAGELLQTILGDCLGRGEVFARRLTACDRWGLSTSLSHHRGVGSLCPRRAWGLCPAF